MKRNVSKDYFLEEKDRNELIDEIKSIIDKFDPCYYTDEELTGLRKYLQTSVDTWNDCETEYQYLVDMFGEGTEEYNFDNYIKSKEEEKLLKRIKTQKSDVFYYFVTRQVMEKLNRAYLEHMSGNVVNFDYKECKVTVYKVD